MISIYKKNFNQSLLLWFVIVTVIVDDAIIVRDGTMSLLMRSILQLSLQSQSQSQRQRQVSKRCIDAFVIIQIPQRIVSKQRQYHQQHKKHQTYHYFPKEPFVSSRPLQNGIISSRLYLSSSSSSVSVSSSADKLIALQKQTSNSINNNNNNNNNSNNSPDSISNVNEIDENKLQQEKHIKHQQNVFDNLVEYFLSEDALPPELVPIYTNMANAIIDAITRTRQQQQQQQKLDGTNNNTVNDNKTSEITTVKVLDVGCGTGVMWEFLANAAIDKMIKIQITGIDVSQNMVSAASDTADMLFDKYMYSTKKDIRPTFTVLQGDITNYLNTLSNDRNPSIYTVKEYDMKSRYDIVLMNACFGNFYNPTTVLANIGTNLLKQTEPALAMITHPLGANFVTKLHLEDPKTVPYTLPTSIRQFVSLTLGLPYELIQLQTGETRTGSETNTFGYYLAIAKRVRAITLRNILKFRGIVQTGYGRGGKKLGFPTANIGCSSTSSSSSSSTTMTNAIQDALQTIPNGVYFGWAVIEQPHNKQLQQNNKDDNYNNDDDGVSIYDTPHKAVVNIGISPTFVGKENPEKIIEAHIMFNTTLYSNNNNNNANYGGTSIPDFYNQYMKLQLIGYLRPEKKFASFPQLIQQIQLDVIEASHALAIEPFCALAKSDPFLSPPTTTTTTTSTTIDTELLSSSLSCYYHSEDLEEVYNIKLKATNEKQVE